MLIDTHCHLDAPEFDADRAAVAAAARAAGVGTLVVPAVHPGSFGATLAVARTHGLPFALGLHPMLVGHGTPGLDAALAATGAALAAHAADPALVAVGEIGLDAVPGGATADAQRAAFDAQLRLARTHGLPVILHVRKAVDAVLAALRRRPVAGGIAHAFNGSRQQAGVFLDMGFKLGFGGAMTFERALHLRRLAVELPLEALVLETDAPDIPPTWLYRTAAERAAGATCRNAPAELPRIAAVLAQLRGLPVQEVVQATGANALAALPRLAPWLAAAGCMPQVPAPGEPE